MCRYLASRVQLRHLLLVLVNNCSSVKEDVPDMQRLCKMENPWVEYLTLITGLRSFNLHTARCPLRDAPFEGRDRCPTTLPLAKRIRLSFNETHKWTAEDRNSGLVIKPSSQRYEHSKNPMPRHLERQHFSAFYQDHVGACISQGFKEQLRAELGIQSLANVEEAERN